MKAMLYADWMNFRQSLRSILFVMVVFAIAAFVWSGPMFFIFTVVFLSIMVPTTLFSADQAYGWNRLSLSLPILRRDVVGSKFLMGLLIATGVVVMLVPALRHLLPVALVLIGSGCAPIYPSIIHATPKRFGEDVALELTGMQMAIAYIGYLAASPAFGVLAQMISVELYPIYLGVFLLAMVAAAECTNRVTRRS